MGEELFKVALNDRHFGFAVGLLSNERAKGAQVCGSGGLSFAWERAYGARGIIQKGLNIMFSINSWVGKWSPPVCVD